MGQLRNLNMCLVLVLILLVDISSNLKPDFNFSSSFSLSSVDKVTIGTKGFVSAIANVVAFALLDSTHLSDQVKIALISKLIKTISRVLRKLLQYFNGSIISTSSVQPSAFYLSVFA